MLCAESVEQPFLRLFVVRFAKDLLGLRGNGVHDSPISIRMSTSLTTVTWGSILRHVGRQESVAYDSQSQSEVRHCYGDFSQPAQFFNGMSSAGESSESGAAAEGINDSRGPAGLRGDHRSVSH